MTGLPAQQPSLLVALLDLMSNTHGMPHSGMLQLLQQLTSPWSTVAVCSSAGFGYQSADASRTQPAGWESWPARCTRLRLALCCCSLRS